MQELVNDLFNKGLSRNTLTSIKGILSNSLNYAVEPLKYIQQSPAIYVKLPLTSAKPEVKSKAHQHSLLSKEEIKAIFERFPENTTAYIPLALGIKCGLRLGEAFAVTWQDINFDEKTLTINKQLQWSQEKRKWYLTPPKYNSVRTIDIDNKLVELLLRTKQLQNENTTKYAEYYTRLYEENHTRIINSQTMGDRTWFINTRENGDFIQPRIMQHTSNVIHKQLNIKEFTFHSLRHTHTTNLLENGIDVKYVQERLGHKNIQVTLNIYQHISKKMKDRNKNLLDSIF